MSIHGKVAKDGLKKSVIFGGSVTVAAAGVGLGIAIPVYFDIQKQFEQAVRDVSDLSRYITDLTTKLGIPPDAEFTKELEGGYQVVVSNGETHIYQSNGNGNRVLIMNTNPDGSVGSATQIQGPAALEILGVLNSAEEEFGGDTEAMNEILEAYKEEAERASRQVESLVLGLDPEEGPIILEIKDAISGDEDWQHENEHELEKLVEIRARVDGERVTSGGSALTDAEWGRLVDEAREQKEAAVRAEEVALDNLDAIKAGTFDFDSSPELKVLVENTENPQIQAAIRAGEEERNQGITDANGRATDAHAAISYERMTEGGGQPNTNSSTFTMITKNPASWMNMFARAMGGAYMSGGHLVSEPSQMLRLSLFNTLTENGTNPKLVENFNNIIYQISGILGIDKANLINNEWQSNRLDEKIENNETSHIINLPHGAKYRSISFNELINTYGIDPKTGREYVDGTQRLFVLKVTITDYDDHGVQIGHSSEGMIVARASTIRNTDFEKLIYFDPISDANKIEAIQYLILASTVDIYGDGGLTFKNEILRTLVNVAESGTVPEEVDDNVFNEFMAITDYIHEQALNRNDLERTLDQRLVPMLQSFLISGIDYKITEDSFSELIEKLIEFTDYDRTIELLSDERATAIPGYTYDSFDDNVWVALFDLIMQPLSANAPSDSIKLRIDTQLSEYKEKLDVIDHYIDNPAFASLFTYIETLDDNYNRDTISTIPTQLTNLYNKLLINNDRVSAQVLNNHFSQLQALSTSSVISKLQPEIMLDLLLNPISDITPIIQSYERLLVINPSLVITSQMQDRTIAAYGITKSLTDGHFSDAQIDRIKAKIDILITDANGLTVNQFNSLKTLVDNLKLIFPESNNVGNENVISFLWRQISQLGTNKTSNDVLLAKIDKFNSLATEAKGTLSTITTQRMFDVIWAHKNEFVAQGKTTATDKNTWDQIKLITDYIWSQPEALENTLWNNFKPLFTSFITKGEQYRITRDTYVNTLTKVNTAEPTTAGIWTQLFNKILEPQSTQLNKTQLLSNMSSLMDVYINTKNDFNYLDTFLNDLDLTELYNIVIEWNTNNSITKFVAHINEVKLFSTTANFNRIPDSLLLSEVRSTDVTITSALTKYVSVLGSIESVQGGTTGTWRRVFDKIISTKTVQSERLSTLDDLVIVMNRLVEIKNDFDFADTIINALIDGTQEQDITDLYTIITTYKTNADLQLIQNHLVEVEGIDPTTLALVDEDLILDAVQSDKTIITNLLEQYARLSRTTLDLTDQDVLDIINDSSVILNNLPSGMSSADVDAVTNGLNAVIVKPTLSAAQMDEIREYSDTISRLFASDTTAIRTQLVKIYGELSITTTQQEMDAVCDKIATFNDWVTAAGGNAATIATITKQMLLADKHVETASYTGIFNAPQHMSMYVGPGTNPVNPAEDQSIFGFGLAEEDNVKIYNIISNGLATTFNGLSLINPSEIASVIDLAQSIISPMSNFVYDSNPSDSILGWFYLPFKRMAIGDGAGQTRIPNNEKIFKIVVSINNGQYEYRIETIPLTGDFYGINMSNIVASQETGLVYVTMGAKIFEINPSARTITSSAFTVNPGKGCLTLFSKGDVDYAIEWSASGMTISYNVGGAWSLLTLPQPTRQGTAEIVSIEVGTIIGNEVQLYILDSAGNITIKYVNISGRNASWVEEKTVNLLSAAEVSALAPGQTWVDIAITDTQIILFGDTKIIYLDYADNQEIFNDLMPH